MTQKERTTIIFVLGGLIALGPLTIDMYLPGFSAIAADLDTTIAMVGLSLTSYFIGISIGQIIYGPLIDRFGRKKPLFVGLLIYAAAAIGCAFSPNIYFLIGIRFILAFGGCVGMVAGRAVVRDLFPTNEIAKIFSSLMLVMGIAPIVAPTLGGYITTHFGWRFIFIILTLFSITILFTVHYFLPQSKAPDANVSLRPGNVLKDYKDVFKEPSFAIYALAGSFSFAGIFAHISGSPFIYMEYFGLSETIYGWIFGLNALGFVVCSQINRLWLRKRNSREIVLKAIAIQSVAGFLLLVYTYLTEPAIVPIFSLILVYIGSLGFIVPNTSAISLQPFITHAGSASALLGSLQMVSGAIASALVSYFHNDTTQPMVMVMATGSFIALGLVLIKTNKTFSGPS